MVRLVKGAYWDSEIKRTQERGLDGYPVFTRKVATDVSYLACARRLLALGPVFYPQFATHNAHTVAAVLELAGERRDCEFQRLHGMGEALYEQIVGPERLDRPCRVYAPVGSHEDLLAYLVRRLLENGANTSFVNRIVDETPADRRDRRRSDRAARAAAGKAASAHPVAARPLGRRGAIRAGSTCRSAGARGFARGACRGSPPAVERRADRRRRRTAGRGRAGLRSERPPPAGRHRRLSRARRARPGARPRPRGAASWDRTPAGERAAMLERAADLFEEHLAELMALDHPRGRAHDPGGARRVARGGRLSALLRAARARRFRRAEPLPGPTGERNELACTVAASSPASRRGIFRWRSSPARSPRRSPPATRSSPSPPSRRRSSPRPRCGCCTRPAFPATCCICCRGPARRSGHRSSPTRASPASPSPARPKRRG